jgi:hypothetical protein
VNVALVTVTTEDGHLILSRQVSAQDLPVATSVDERLGRSWAAILEALAHEESEGEESLREP